MDELSIIVKNMVKVVNSTCMAIERWQLGCGVGFGRSRRFWV